MIFENVSPSAIRSIRQRDLLKEWLRHYLPKRTLPAFAAFRPERIDDEMPDLMFCALDDVGGEPRYRVLHEGKRLTDAYCITALGRHLQDVFDPAVWMYLEPIYARCVSAALPVYSAFHVTDTEGRQVDYERLLLPFGENGSVQNIVASIKSICAEGRFVNAGLMQPANHAPQYTLRAVVSAGLTAPARHAGLDGDVVSL